MSPSELDADVLAFVAEALPRPPARVLEVGAGSGELAAALRHRGWEVTAIDPVGVGEVVPVALEEFDGGRTFDAAVAVVSLHHIDALDRACRRLAALLRPDAPLIVDEFDVSALDTRAAAWWLERRRDHQEHEHRDPDTLREQLRAELHPLERIRAALAEHSFEPGPITRGPYLYRWDLPPQDKALENQAIQQNELPAVGARFIARRLGRATFPARSS